LVRDLALALSGVAWPLGANATATGFPVPPNGYLTVTWNFSALPNYVTWGNLQLNYDLPLVMNGQNANNGTGGNFGGGAHKLFLVDSAPVDTQQTPWVDFLQYMCTAAHGYSGSTQVASKLTTWLNDNSFYTPDQPNYYFDLFNDDPRIAGGHTFDLEMLIEAWNDNETFIDSCHGFGALLAICFHGMGINAVNRMVCHPSMNFPPPPSPTARGLRTIPLKGAGLGSYRTYDFISHAYVVSSGLAYDASAKREFNLSGQSYDQPPQGWGHTGFIQTGSAAPFRGTFQGLTNPVSIQQILSNVEYFDRSFSLL
jgi:hypothetical protein